MCDHVSINICVKLSIMQHCNWWCKKCWETTFRWKNLNIILYYFPAITIVTMWMKWMIWWSTVTIWECFMSRNYRKLLTATLLLNEDDLNFDSIAAFIILFLWESWIIKECTHGATHSNKRRVRFKTYGVFRWHYCPCYQCSQSARQRKRHAENRILCTCWTLPTYHGDFANTPVVIMWGFYLIRQFVFSLEDQNTYVKLTASQNIYLKYDLTTPTI